MYRGIPRWSLEGHRSPLPHPTLLHPCASASAPACTSAPYSVLPPIYAQRAAAPAPLRTLLAARAPSPRAQRTSARTNGHAHVGRQNASSISWGRG
jgi:hypothetical protein